MSILLLAAVAACLAVMAVHATRRGGLLMALVLAQVAYWSISFLGRPLLLLVVVPPPRPDDALADTRLVASGSYAEGLAAVLPVVVVGLVGYLLVLLALTSRSPRRRVVQDLPLLPLAVFYVVGWTCRLLLVSGTDNPVTSTASGLAPLAAVLACVAVRRPGRLATWVPLVTVFVGESAWSWLYASKTPVLAVLLAVGLRLLTSGVTRRNAVRLAVVAAVGAVAFSLVQLLKNDAGTARDLDRVDSTYPVWVRPVLPVLRRFDLLSGTTDAVALGPGGWLDPAGYGHRAVVAAVGFAMRSEHLSAGRAWAEEVRAHSVPTRGSGVSLAEGAAAEGYLVAGPAGAMAAMGGLALLTVLVVRCLASSRRFPLYLGALLVSGPVLFERGPLGAVETTAQAVQTAVLALLLTVLLTGRRAPAATAAETPAARQEVMA